MCTRSEREESGNEAMRQDREMGNLRAGKMERREARRTNAKRGGRGGERQMWGECLQETSKNIGGVYCTCKMTIVGVLNVTQTTSVTLWTTSFSQLLETIKCCAFCVFVPVTNVKIQHWPDFISKRNRDRETDWYGPVTSLASPDLTSSYLDSAS